jgi:hypothetical protein
MGWYFRRSVKFGPLRVNFSKSGVGYSFGMRGLRVGSGPRGPYVVLVFRRLLERWDEAKYLKVDQEDDVLNCSVTAYRAGEIVNSLPQCGRT